MIDFINPLKQLITGLKSLLSISDDTPEESFFDALRQTLSEKDFKGSIYEIHHIHSQHGMIIRNLNENHALSEVNYSIDFKT